MFSVIAVYERDLNLTIPRGWEYALEITEGHSLTNLFFKKRGAIEVGVCFHLDPGDYRQLQICHHTPNLSIVVDGEPLPNSVSANVRNGAGITLVETDSGLEVRVTNQAN